MGASYELCCYCHCAIQVSEDSSSVCLEQSAIVRLSKIQLMNERFG